MNRMSTQQQHTSPLEELLHKLSLLSDTTSPLSACTRSNPYLLLIQHSQSSAKLRYLASQPTQRDDAAVYRRARLRTPSENAIRDLNAGTLWWDYLFELVIQKFCGSCSSSSSSSSSSRISSSHQFGGRKKIVVLQTKATTTTIRSNKISIDDNLGLCSSYVHTIDLSQDPFGWDRHGKDSKEINDDDGDDDHDHDDTSSDDNTTVDLNHLDRILCNIQQLTRGDTGVSAVLIDSLTPFWMRHGFHRTMQFLLSIQQHISPKIMIVPVDTSSACLSKQQHRALEDLSSAVLCLRHGEAVMLRQGVRERDNVVRQNIAYEISQNKHGRSVIQILESDDTFLPDVDDTRIEKESEDLLSSSGATSKQTISSQPTTRKPKVQLALNEDVRVITLSSASAAATSAATVATTTTSTGPHIFLQDDDPEFDDYDEEDPDDDLEI